MFPLVHVCIVQRFGDENDWNRALSGKSMKLGIQHLYHVNMCKFRYSVIAHVSLRGCGTNFQ